MTVSVADLKTKFHNHCFDEFAAAMDHVLTLAEFRRPVIFGANSSDCAEVIPEDAILYNAEPIAVHPRPLTLLARTDRVVWDYSAANVTRWRELDVKAIHCPVGYHETMTSIAETKQDIDVLFYGTKNVRRTHLLDRLTSAGIRVLCLPYNTYGTTRDRWIARAKVVLNLHFHDPGTFEIFRVSHLLANRKCVLTEGGGQDEQLEAFAKRSCAYAHPFQLIEACHGLLADDKARQAQAHAGHFAFTNTSLADNVRKAITES